MADAAIVNRFLGLRKLKNFECPTNGTYNPITFTPDPHGISASEVKITWQWWLEIANKEFYELIKKSRVRYYAD